MADGSFERGTIYAKANAKLTKFAEQMKEFMDAARRLKQPIPMEILLKPNLEDYGGVLDRVENSDAQAIVLWTRAEEAARVVRQIRRRWSNCLMRNSQKPSRR